MSGIRDYANLPKEFTVGVQMHTFTRGQTVTLIGTEAHGLVVDAYRHNGIEMVSVHHSRRTPPISYRASELQAYIVQSPDTVLLMDDAGGLWAFEVLDVSGDGTHVLIKEDGGLGWVAMTEITRVIPSSIALLMNLYGAQS